MSSTTRETTSPTTATPRPALSVFDAAMIITGIVIGGGIFSFPALVAGIAGSVQWMFIAWVLGAVLSLIGALCYAELATTFPSAGGDYDFLTRAYGKDVSFFYAWARGIVILPGSIALLGFVFGDYMTRVFSLGPYSSAIYAGLTVVVLTGVNIAGLRDSARTQNILTVLLVAGMLLIALAGTLAPAAAPSATKPFDQAIPAGLGTCLLFVLFTYSGWSEAAYVSAEVKGGPRSLVRALVVALTLITALYLLFVAGLVQGLGFDGLTGSKTPAADVAKHAFGATGEKLVGVVVSLAALTSINGTILIGARLNYAVAGHWRIVRFMSRWDPARDVPVAALIAQGVISLGLVALAASESGVRTMVEFTSPVFWFFISLIAIAVIVLRFKFMHVSRPFRVPFYPLLPIAFIGTCAYLLYRSIVYAQSEKAVHISLYVMAVGFVVWIIARIGRNT